MTPHSPDNLDDDRLFRYLSGACSAAERHAVERWVHGTPERRRRMEVLRQGWNAAGGLPLLGDVEKGWAAMAAQLEDARPPRVLHLVPSAPGRPRWVAALPAAGVMLIAGTAALLVHLAEQRHDTVRAAGRASTMREIATQPGQRADVYLSDGTHVVLGVASRLRFPASFGASRDVELTGQGYFDVAHDERRPFAVHTAHAVARNVGTKFDVRAYGETEDVAVVVAEGAVMLKAAADSVMLRPTFMGRVSRDGRLATPRAIDAAAYVAWTNGRLIFQQTPAAEAVAQLGRWYGADVRLGDTTLAGLALTASITNESLPQALDIITGALDARIERRGSVITLYANHHSR